MILYGVVFKIGLGVGGPLAATQPRSVGRLTSELIDELPTEVNTRISQSNRFSLMGPKVSGTNMQSSSNEEAARAH
jgi:hypothetical protein